MRPAPTALLLLLFINYAKAYDPVLRASLPPDSSIAIVGAGVSGLSAAHRLLTLGYTDVTVFEASARIGGRVHPLPFADGYLQMGAEYINGDQNPIFRMAESLGILERVQADYDAIEGAAYATGGCPLEEEDADAFYEFADPLKEKYRQMAGHSGGNQTHGVKELFHRDYANFVQSKPESKRTVFDALARLHESYFAGEWASNFSDLSIRNFAQWDSLDPGPQTREFIMNRFGYKAILNHIAAGIPRSIIKFNSFVKLIDYSEGDKVKLTLKSGKLAKSFDAVIVTVALGHLKRFSKKLFVPPLPHYKQEAIDALGFGALGKLFLVYSEPFWEAGVGSLVTLPMAECAREQEPTDAIYKTFEPVAWRPNVLLGWLSGEGPYMVDAMSNQQVKTSVTALFRRMFRNESIPEPTTVLRSKWTRNPLFGGSYSYITVKAARANISFDRLAAPLLVAGRPRVLFAGEATHSRIFQTTIGAYLSGIREADRLFGHEDTGRTN